MDINDIPFFVLGAAASVRDSSIKTPEDMIKKGKEIYESSKSRTKTKGHDTKLEATLQQLVKKGKEERQELVESVGKTVKDTLDKLGIVTKADIKDIERRLSELEKKITAKKPAQKTSKPAKKPAVKTAGKK